MINFSLSDLRLICDSSTFSRGYDYNESSFSEIKNVSMISDDILQILSTTTGTKLYKQTTNVYNQNDNIKIIGKCSCPVGRNCKHVVSSCLAYLESDLEEEEIEVFESKDDKHSWLQKLEDSFDPIKKEEKKTSTTLLYLLHPSKDLESIEMSVYTARVLKSGGYGKVNRARVSSLFNIHRPPEFIKKDDAEVISYFKYLAELVKTTAVLKGELGAFALEAAVKTGRCYWQRSFKEPMKLYEEKDLSMSWSEDRASYKINPF